MDLFIGIRQSDHQFILQDKEYHHCVRVTRHKVGDSILTTDFSGIIYESKIREIDQVQLIAEIIKEYKRESSEVAQISIAISLTHPIDRFEWFVEKAVENGIHEIIPMVCKRTESHKLKMERMHKIIESAAKQTLRPLKPVMHELIKSDELIIQRKDTDQKFIGHCEDGLEGFLGQKYNPQKNVLVLIGPAGDFTGQEIEMAKLNEYIPISLGAYRLRTETAGLTALQILQTIRQL
jgi:16S rRNA (uracil1498-N3)-methyltransferase